MKQQDIRNLFNDDDVSKMKLPESHRDEFLEKLKASKIEEQKAPNYRLVYKIAAMFTLFFALGIIVFNQFNQEDIEASTIELQIKTIEQKYLVNIETEWQSFLVVATGENLIKRFEKRLNELDHDYQEISKDFKNDTSNIVIIEALVENLQTRLQLLKDIQEHIKILNQENEHETTL
ncbi:MAG: hypothetical protein KAJ28_10610 [Flavobacteriaceae bacterium]|nr:hypothetical protein [Flavobacteriaceae bacterium]